MNLVNFFKKGMMNVFKKLTENARHRWKNKDLGTIRALKPMKK